MPASFRLGSALGLLCCSFAALQACGGRSDTEDFRFTDELPNGGANGVGASSPGGAVSSGGKKPTGTAGSGTVVGGSSGVGGSGVVQGGNVGVAGQGQGGVPSGGVGQAGSGGVGGTGVGGTGVVVPVTCGNVICDASVDTCCATLGGFGCIPAGQTCNGAVLNCGSTGDCEGNQVCCLSIINDVGSGSACKDACDGMGGGRERQLCGTDADCRGNRKCRDTVFGVAVCTRF